MITAKFGGTAVTAQNLHCIKNILTPAHKCVVVSAIGREHPNDSKTTDLLQAHFFGDPTAWQKVCEKYRRMVVVNGIDLDVDELLYSAQQRARAYDLAYCMSLGEELSGKIVAKFLSATYLEAQDLIVFNGNHVLQSATYDRIQKAFLGLSRGVVGGFYGGCVQTPARKDRPVCKPMPRQIFSRGGGDVSGAIFAAATGSALYENWTDVYGVCLADPKSISGVATAHSLSYHEMRLLAQNGAQVLHPQAVGFVQKLGIPIRIANYLNPAGPDTLVSNCPSGLPLLLANERKRKGAFFTTVLFTLPTQQVVQIFGEMLQNLSGNPTQNSGANANPPVTVFSCNFFANKAEILTSQSILKAIYNAFSALS